MIPVYSIKGAAIATTTTMFLGTIMSSVYLYNRFKTLISLKSIIKIIFTSLIIYYLALNYQFSGLMLIPTYMVLIGIYFLILLAINEIKQQDIMLVRNIIKKWIPTHYPISKQKKTVLLFFLLILERI